MGIPAIPPRSTTPTPTDTAREPPHHASASSLPASAKRWIWFRRSPRHRPRMDDTGCPIDSGAHPGCARLRRSGGNRLDHPSKPLASTMQTDLLKRKSPVPEMSREPGFVHGLRRRTGLPVALVLEVVLGAGLVIPKRRLLERFARRRLAAQI